MVYGYQELFADFGGYLGLLIGASILSIYDDVVMKDACDKEQKDEENKNKIDDEILISSSSAAEKDTVSVASIVWKESLGMIPQDNGNDDSYDDSYDDQDD